MNRRIGYFHVAAVQILVKWRGSSGLDIPLTILARDLRLVDPKQQIIGIYSSNLYSGSVYTEIPTDIMVSAQDPHKTAVFSIDVKAYVQLLEGSKGISVSIISSYVWVNKPHPGRRRVDEYFTKSGKMEGRSIYVLSKGMDIKSIPQPIAPDALDVIRDSKFDVHLTTKEASSPEFFYGANGSLHVRFPHPRDIAESSQRDMS